MTRVKPSAAQTLTPPATSHRPSANLWETLV